MNQKHHASNCRWSAPALLLASPWWMEAENRPWACVHDGIPRVLDTTAECSTCADWEPLHAEKVPLRAAY
jgi:hypothetical protein